MHRVIFFQAEDGIRDIGVTGVQTCALPIFHDNFVAEISGQRSLVTRLSRFFERTCDERPSATALECDGDRVSYADLDQRANRLANLLMARGARAGVRVGILLHRSVDTYVALLAVTKTEATFVPIDPERS